MTALRITGILARQARSATGIDGSAWLDVELAQAELHAARLVARRCYGTGPAAQLAASNAARHLRSGTTVTVHAQTLDVRLHPTPHVVLWGVDLIEQHATSAPRSKEAA